MSDPTAAGAAGMPRASAVATAAVGRRRGAVHDLGYQRYTGTRRPQRSRYRVISANLIGAAWQGFWRFKAWLTAAVIVSIVIGVVIYLATHNILAAVAIERLGVSAASALQPFAWQWYLRIAFVVSLSIGAAVVAGDLRSGAFVFYFARPVRPLDYVLGKLCGLLVLNGLLLIAAPMAVMLVNLGLSTNRAELVENLNLLPRCLAVGVVASLAFSAIPLGFSAITARKRVGVAVWAVFYQLVGSMLLASALAARSSTLAAFDVTSAIMGLVVYLFDARIYNSPLFGTAVVPSPGLALTVLAVYSAGSIGLAFDRVSSEERAGLGSSS